MRNPPNAGLAMSLRYAILGFLTIRPFSGYDIKRYFDNSVRHFWNADQAAIYRTLADLEKDQLVGHERVEQQTRPDRKLYHITPAGIAELDAWLVSPAAAVVRREPLLLKLFFTNRLGAEGLSAVINAELGAVEAELAEFKGILESIERDRAEVLQQLGDGDAADGYRQVLVGPLITLTNGVRLGVAYRDWLRGLTHAQEQGELTDTAMLAELRRLVDDV
jgi:PadR family transcriptional regulator, regulatory protein AphA